MKNRNAQVVDGNPTINRELNQANQANTGLRVIERTRCWLYVFKEKEVIVPLSIFIIV
ncbi:20330_t:CDS:1, partial [Gigaspora rosea]